MRAVLDLVLSVENYIRRQKPKLMAAGDRVGVAVSGGVDSVALLRLLLDLRAELGIVLSVVHFNHQLRAIDADFDEQFVRELAEQHGLHFYCGNGDVRQAAQKNHLSVEAAARKLRYAYFGELLASGTLNRIATGHTLDDQAETVLLRLARGAGTRGLAGIHPAVSITNDGWIVRPLLTTRRTELELYLNSRGQTWREDKSNRDLRYARNRVRHGILPRLERHLNPSVREALASTAEIARSEEEYWKKEVDAALLRVWNSESSRLNYPALRELPLALQRRIIRAAGEQLNLRLEFKHVEQILEMTGSASVTRIALPQDWTLTREKDCLRFSPLQRESAKEHDYSYILCIPGDATLPEAGLRIQAAVVSGAPPSYNSQHLFEPDLLELCLYEPGLLGPELKVRNWCAGDRFWPAHTKAPKKIKELLQERHITGKERTLWPVITSGDEIIWVRGFPVPAHLQPKGDQAVVIQAIVMRGESLTENCMANGDRTHHG